ncbi:hypothetical protein SCB49_12234 [unidentified eubacterium SCB49]|nr:hypothetical protein SCB49_12234 [unidentified eubacterium SCB49]
MISHYHKCIFIHIPKAAGTSIESYFLDDLGIDFEDKLPLLLGKTTNMYASPKVISHLTASQMLNQHYISQELFDAYFKFVVVRNPLKRLFSTYIYLGYSRVINFETFVLRVFPKLTNESDKAFFLQPQSNFVYNKEGKLLVDFVGKLENLESDFHQIQSRLNLPLSLLPHKNKAKSTNSLLRGFKKIILTPHLLFHLNLSSKKKLNLSQKSLEIVFNYYKADYDNFGYSKKK